MNIDDDELWRARALLDEVEEFSGALDLLLSSELKNDSLEQLYIAWVYSTRNEFVLAEDWYLDLSVRVAAPGSRAGWSERFEYGGMGAKELLAPACVYGSPFGLLGQGGAAQLEKS